MNDKFGWVPENIQLIGSEDALKEALRNGHIRAVSDGSFKANIGTAAVMIRTKKSARNMIKIRCRTPGLPRDQSAYQSELIGTLTAIMIITWLRENLTYLRRSNQGSNVVATGWLLY